ncbi:MAG: 3-hydroxyacyl-CoA dehydrogenase family protein [Solirubrobacterales bacterium]
MEVKKVAVLGAGTMGMGIAQVFAQSGIQVVLYDIKIEIVEKAIARIGKIIAKAVEKGQAPDGAKDFVLGNITGSADLKDLADVDVVVESIVENLEIKLATYKKLDEACKPEAIFATNTSSLSITEMAAVTKRPQQVVGMHFFNPAQVMALIEVIPALQTSDDTFNVIYELSKKIGKKPIKVKEGPGFVVNRILVPGLNEAAYILMEGLASEKDIDTAMRLGAGWPMGPLTLADMVGLDIALEVCNVLYRETGDPKYRPCSLIKQYVRAGWLGRKTGRGFYDYSESK